MILNIKKRGDLLTIVVPNEMAMLMMATSSLRQRLLRDMRFQHTILVFRKSSKLLGEG
jgi:hypothetical protein